MATKLKGKCWSCGKVWPEDELDEVHDFWGRVPAGDEMPLGQCPDPECGMLCHLVKEPQKIIVVMDGGLVQGIHGVPTGVEVEVRDFDIEGTHLEIHRTPDGEEYVRTIWTDDA